MVIMVLKKLLTGYPQNFKSYLQLCIAYIYIRKKLVLKFKYPHVDKVKALD